MLFTLFCSKKIKNVDEVGKRFFIHNTPAVK